VEGYVPVYEPTLFVKVRFYVRVVHRHLKVVDDDFGDMLKVSCRFEIKDSRQDDGHDGNEECKDRDNCFPHCFTPFTWAFILLQENSSVNEPY
jgi:hypothetical protein